MGSCCLQEHGDFATALLNPYQARFCQRSRTSVSVVGSGSGRDRGPMQCGSGDGACGGAAASVWRDRPSGRRAGSGWGRGRTDWNPLSSLTSCKPSDMGDQLEKLTPVPQSCTRLAQDSDPQGRRPRDCRSGSEARPAMGRCVPWPHLAPHADLRNARAVAAALPARWPAPTQNRPRQGILGAGTAALLSPYRRQPPPFTSGRFGVPHTSPSQIKTGAEPWPSVTGLSFRLRDGKRPAAPTMLGVSRTLPGESLQLRR